MSADRSVRSLSALAMPHIASFWKYRFPAGAPRHADVEELATIFRDFLNGVGAHAALAN